MRVRHLRHLGFAPPATGQDWALVGQDGGQSIELADRTLFVFSDTLIARLSAPSTGAPPEAATVLSNQGQGIFLANCAAISSSDGLREAMDSLAYFSDERGRPREILEATAIERLAGVRFWPQHGVPHDDRVYVYYLGIQHLQEGTWGFESLGTGLAVFDPVTGGCERVRSNDDWCLWNVDKCRFHLGVQVFRQDRTVYAFGSRRLGTDNRAVLARVDVDRIADPAAYEYLVSCRPEWTGNVERTGDLGPSGAEYSVSFNAYLQKYLMIYVDGFDKQLIIRTAEQLWGPYSAPESVGRLPHQKDVPFISLGFEHPRYVRREGRTVLVSYCQPNFIQNGLVAVTFA